ncbi:MAG: hypothetical protein GEU79_12545 [Acidimicrobiia bacterium]|nr:hypothetical protein [Acidimicrobiia bacterium]
MWLTETYDNILFAMNTHSFGGYFMWSPGAYIADGRVPLPRPPIGTEEYFFAASADILDRIKAYRGTVVHPGRTGPVIDVLYSAAGNSGDEHYYTDDLEGPDIYAWDFEVGADLWDGEEWESPGFFWPDFETEGFHQAMEFSNGWIGMMEVALEFSQDDQAPSSSINVDQRGWYSGPVDVVFTTSEAATIHYTLDMSKPTLDSPTLERDGLRDGAAPLEITETTVLRWFAVDETGNQEKPHRVRIKIRD